MSLDKKLLITLTLFAVEWLVAIIIWGADSFAIPFWVFIVAGLTLVMFPIYDTIRKWFR